MYSRPDVAGRTVPGTRTPSDGVQTASSAGAGREPNLDLIERRGVTGREVEAHPMVQVAAASLPPALLSALNFAFAIAKSISVGVADPLPTIARGTHFALATKEEETQ